MSRTEVWKFPIAVANEFDIMMPAGSEILHVDTQNEAPFLWARVNPEATRYPRRFLLRGTGHPIENGSENGCKHVGSFMLADGGFVGHLFEPESQGNDAT